MGRIARGQKRGKVGKLNQVVILHCPECGSRGLLHGPFRGLMYCSDCGWAGGWNECTPDFRLLCDKACARAERKLKESVPWGEAK